MPLRRFFVLLLPLVLCLLPGCRERPISSRLVLSSMGVECSARPLTAVLEVIREEKNETITVQGESFTALFSAAERQTGEQVYLGALQSIVFSGVPDGSTLRGYLRELLADGRLSPNTQIALCGDALSLYDGEALTGDILLSLDGITLTSNEQMGALVQGSGGRPVQLVYQRQGRQYTARLTPQKSLSDSRWHLGLWVRDSSAGIGTVTYFDENARTFSGLGHPICDVDTGEIMTLSTGEGVEAVITGYTTGKSGSPGELKGQFVAGRTFAGLTANGECGVCGSLRPDYIPQGERLPVAFSHEVQPGPAKMLTTIAGGAPREYDVVIEKVLRGSGHAGQNMVIRVTDEALLQKTGGILQGMSGSPLVQNGMLVGAVTHVFVDEPDRGYAIFAETVRNAEKNLDQTTRNAA